MNAIYKVVFGGLISFEKRRKFIKRIKMDFDQLQSNF
jgi:hypothetical protein